MRCASRLASLSAMRVARAGLFALVLAGLVASLPPPAAAESSSQLWDAFDKAARDLATTSFDEVTAKAGARNGLQFFLAVLSILAGLVGAGLVAGGIGQRRREFA